MTDRKHTALPWKAVSEPNFDNGLVYTSIQPVNVDEEAMKPLAMMNGEFHVCRMSHTAASWRFNYHRVDAAFIVEACNSYYETRDALSAKDAEIARLRAALHEIATVDEYRGLSAEEAMSVAQAALKAECGAA
ncbi:hypothetical protein [Rhizobium leguminosarum]|uniref:hypothetical protein n=1 Tax=Rhizobium leguminosarum TaxID=384 RepID=UPI00102F81F0|nr:hypothetical protein [Rhizobium leguminosarum]TAV89275.1 hypothetical protein ELI22_08640 [Rhizobium leguminosarum]TAV93855.1 hypothetical protein ELI21_08630 [Rhizobium leguminosarum]TAW34931.1 hypothetical protein ELI23_08670 [Rhizobium leguminosarum]